MTIKSKPAVGICGSGLLIIIATLYECGVIDQSGRFNRNLAQRPYPRGTQRL